MRMVHSLLQTKASSAKFWECKSEWDSIPLIWTTYSLAETRNDMVVAGLGEDEETFSTMLPQAVCTTGAGAGVGACSDIPTWAGGTGQTTGRLGTWVLSEYMLACSGSTL